MMGLGPRRPRCQVWHDPDALKDTTQNQHDDVVFGAGLVCKTHTCRYSSNVTTPGAAVVCTFEAASAAIDDDSSSNGQPRKAGASCFFERKEGGELSSTCSWPKLLLEAIRASKRAAWVLPHYLGPSRLR